MAAVVGFDTVTGPRMRTVLAAGLLGVLVSWLVRGLRGDPFPDASRHPSVDVGDRTGPIGLASFAPRGSPASGGAGGAARTGVSTPDPAPGADPEPATRPEPDPGPPRAPAPTPGSWVPPVDGGCPPGHPVKAKLGSGIYHLPGMAFYDRTTPDRCYSDATAAEADGLRVAKR